MKEKKAKQSMLYPMTIAFFGLVILTLLAITLKPVLTGETVIVTKKTAQLSKNNLVFACMMSKNARYYGSITSSHTVQQQQMLEGKLKKIPFIDCSKKEYSELCRQKNIIVYPTWEISNKLHPGKKTIKELKKISDCTNF